MGPDPNTAVLVSNPVPVLPVAEVLSCEGVYTFTQSVIELGDASVARTSSHKTRALSANVVPATSTAFTKDVVLADVTVPNFPMLSAFVHYTETCVDGAGAGPGIPWRQRECGPICNAFGPAFPCAHVLLGARCTGGSKTASR